MRQFFLLVIKNYETENQPKDEKNPFTCFRHEHEKEMQLWGITGTKG